MNPKKTTLSAPIPDPPDMQNLPWYGRERVLPPYRFVPGLHPHPIRDPDGHSRRAARAQVHPPWSPEQWRTLEAYLRGVDLFNRFYFWEAHEVWEALWKSHPPGSEPARFIQGLINLSAAFLKLHMGEDSSCRKLRRAAEERLHPFREKIWMGISVGRFLDEVGHYLNSTDASALPVVGPDTPPLRLLFS